MTIPEVWEMRMSLRDRCKIHLMRFNIVLLLAIMLIHFNQVSMAKRYDQFTIPKTLVIVYINSYYWRRAWTCVQIAKDFKMVLMGQGYLNRFPLMSRKNIWV